MQHMTVNQLKAVLENNISNPVLLDVREPWEYHTCHLQNSTHIPMNDIWHSYGDLDPQREIVVICQHGVRSMRVCTYLQQYGFQNVVNLDGGLEEWAKKIDPAMPTY